MSDQIERAAAAVAENPDAVTHAVQTSHATAAPTDPLEQRLAGIEAFIRRYQPIIEAAETLLSAEVPSLDPIINKISQLQTWAAALADHFQHKIPALPSGG